MESIFGVQLWLYDGRKPLGICQLGKVAIIEIMMLIIVISMLRGLKPFPKMPKVSNSL